MASKTQRTRGVSKRILGLSSNVRRELRRALIFDGDFSVSQWLDDQVRHKILNGRASHGNLLKPAPVEQEIIAAIADGHAEPETIADATLIPLSKVKRLLPGLAEMGYLRTERKGGKTEGARGAVSTLYFLPRGK